MKLSCFIVVLNDPWFSLLLGTIIVHEPTHVLIDDHVSQIIDMEISDQ